MKSYRSNTLNIIHIANQNLNGFVKVDLSDFASFYLWHDNFQHNEFGDKTRYYRGDTIYLSKQSHTPLNDLFHEIGHVVGRKFNIIPHRENNYSGTWNRKSTALSGRVKNGQHWSQYLNIFGQQHSDFQVNAKSELWAELFMMWYLYPDSDELMYIQKEMYELSKNQEIKQIEKLADRLQRQ